ncbi:Rhomboid family protein [Rubripirellula amarantea]|uniref:Rhomboid family protein n=1 Tax=Rubripirellula amarantea TaxID=2527999 RepID=A0A5C5WE14_9BACT|nr:rhomboid family intramembrane serine protease [Rubripirellula amarantea]TWT49118.1 Rhomboid family protein [Rubripirellula amarantea]
MNPPPTEAALVFQTPHQKACQESRLVLEAVGIACEAIHRDGVWQLWVRPEDRDAAIGELSGYQQDQSLESNRKRTPTPVFGGSWWGVIVYATTLILIASVSLSPPSQEIWRSIGRMHAGDVMAGQLYRVVTALTLHADSGHLLSNLGYGGLFGLLTGRILGGGIGWLTILVAGAGGNLINAMARNADHASIGASTAVFAALGIMVAHALRPRPGNQQTAMERWRPLIGGALLMAFTGIGGENTDVGAHFAGFAAGLVLGAAVARLPYRWLDSTKVQMTAGSVAIAIVTLAWTIAIAKGS